MNETGSSKPGAESADIFGDIEDLDARGRRVFLRVDPYLIDSLDAASPSAGSLSAGSLSAGSPSPDSLSAGSANAGSLSPDSLGKERSLAPAGSERAPEKQVSTLRRLLELDARVIIGTHFSPAASADTGLSDVEALATQLSERLAVEVLMPDECVGDAALRVLHELRQGQICVLPDLLKARSGGEQKNDEAFARALASHVDAYVFEAFSASHLEYASLVRLPRLVARRALGGHARRELEGLSRVFSLSRGSVAMALGGRKFSDKVDTLSGWLPRVNTLCVGGGAAATLLLAAGRMSEHPGAELDRLAQARSLLGRARDLGVQVLLPVDLRVQLDGERETQIVSPLAVPARSRVVDVGPESVARFAEALGGSQSLLWWGPFGDVQHPSGSLSSLSIAEVCASPNIQSVVLGGDTRHFVRQLGPEITRGIDLISSGSAAAEALLSGRRLPAIEALRARR